MKNRPLGLAHLSALHLNPPELVEAASAAGFASVGVRVFPATSGEQRYPMGLGSAMLAETQRRLSDTGISVMDIEALTLDGVRSRGDWMPALESGAALGANVLNVICADADKNRLADTLALLVQDAAEHGIRPSVEPISYQPLSTISKAAELAAQTGCGIMIDTLHFVRAGNQLADLAALAPENVAVIQLCDGLDKPPRFRVPEHMPLGQSTAGTELQLESRARRLPPGEGVFPLAQVCATFPAAPISVEVPDVEFVQRFGVEKHLERIYTAARKLNTKSIDEEKWSK